MRSFSVTAKLLVRSCFIICAVVLVDESGRNSHRLQVTSQIHTTRNSVYNVYLYVKLHKNDN